LITAYSYVCLMTTGHEQLATLQVAVQHFE